MPSNCGGRKMLKTLKLKRKRKRKRKRKSTGKKKTSQKGGAYGNTMNSLSNNAQGGI